MVNDDNSKTYNNRLGKVKYLVDHLNNAMKVIYILQDCLSLHDHIGCGRVGLFFANTLKRKGTSMAHIFFQLCHYDGIIFEFQFIQGSFTMMI